MATRAGETRVDRETAVLAVQVAADKIRSGLRELPNLDGLIFKIENVLITAQRFQLPRPQINAEILRELEEVIECAEIIGPELLDAADRLRRFGASVFRPHQTRQHELLVKLTSLATRVFHARPTREDLKPLAKLLTEIKDISMSPDDVILTILQYLGASPIPSRLRQVLETVKDESPQTPWTASDLREPTLIKKRQADLARHAKYLDSVVSVLVHQKERFPIDARDLADAVDLTDALQILLKTLAALPAAVQEVLEKVRGLEEVAAAASESAATLLVEMQPLVKSLGLDYKLKGANRKFRRRVDGGTEELCDVGAVVVVTMYFLTAGLGVAGAVLLVSAVVVKGKALNFNGGLIMISVILMSLGALTCLIAACAGRSGRPPSRDIASSRRPPGRDGDDENDDETREALLAEQQRNFHTRDGYRMHGPVTGGAFWREPRRGHIPPHQIQRDLREKQGFANHPISRAAQASMYTRAGPSAAVEMGAVRSASSVTDASVMAEIAEYAVWLGIDPIADEDLLWIAQQAYFAPVPQPWSEHADSMGNVYYYNKGTKESTWAHPLESQYMALAAKSLQEKYGKAPGGKTSTNKIFPVPRSEVQQPPPRLILEAPSAEERPEVLELQLDDTEASSRAQAPRQQQQQRAVPGGAVPQESYPAPPSTPGGGRRIGTPPAPGDPFVRQRPSSGQASQQEPPPQLPMLPPELRQRGPPMTGAPQQQTFQHQHPSQHPQQPQQHQQKVQNQVNFIIPPQLPIARGQQPPPQGQFSYSGPSPMQGPQVPSSGFIAGYTADQHGGQEYYYDPGPGGQGGHAQPRARHAQGPGLARTVSNSYR